MPQSTQILDLGAAQATVEAWMREQTVGYWKAVEMGDKLAEELGEVTEAFNFKPEELALELGDVLFAVICLANTHVDPLTHKEPLQLAFGDVKKTEGGSEGSGVKPTELLAMAIGKVAKDILRLHGPKKKDNFNQEDLKNHLCGVLDVVNAIAQARQINLAKAWEDAMQKYNMRDATRWK